MNTTKQTILANLTRKQIASRKRALASRGATVVDEVLDLIYKPVSKPLANPVLK